jgi:hypothetical protein
MDSLVILAASRKLEPNRQDALQLSRGVPLFVLELECLECEDFESCTTLELSTICWVSGERLDNQVDEGRRNITVLFHASTFFVLLARLSRRGGSWTKLTLLNSGDVTGRNT